MATFSRLYITKTGQALLARLLAGSISNVKYTSIKLSNQVYAESAVENLTTLASIKQSGAIHEVKRVNDYNVQVSAIFPNAELTVGYYVKTVGLYAYDPTAGAEVLYAACVESGESCYMPANNGQTSTDLMFRMTTNVGNAQNVSLAVDPAAVASINQINEIHDILDNQGTRITVMETMTQAFKSFGGLNEGDGETFLTVGGSENEVLAFVEDPLKDIDDKFAQIEMIDALRDKRISEAYRQIQTKADQTQTDDLQDENDRQTYRIEAIETQLDTGIEQRLLTDGGYAIRLSADSDEYLSITQTTDGNQNAEINRLQSLVDYLYKQLTTATAGMEYKLKSAVGGLSARIDALEAAASSEETE